MRFRATPQIIDLLAPVHSGNVQEALSLYCSEDACERCWLIRYQGRMLLGWPNAAYVPLDERGEQMYPASWDAPIGYRGHVDGQILKEIQAIYAR